MKSYWNVRFSGWYCVHCFERNLEDLLQTESIHSWSTPRNFELWSITLCIIELSSSSSSFNPKSISSSGCCWRCNESSNNRQFGWIRERSWIYERSINVTVVNINKRWISIIKFLTDGLVIQAIYRSLDVFSNWSVLFLLNFFSFFFVYNAYIRWRFQFLSWPWLFSLYLSKEIILRNELVLGLFLSSFFYFTSRFWTMNQSNSHLEKVKTYLLAASGRRTVKNSLWIDDVPSESFTLPKYEVRLLFRSKNVRRSTLIFCSGRNTRSRQTWKHGRLSTQLFIEEFLDRWSYSRTLWRNSTIDQWRRTTNRLLDNRYWKYSALSKICWDNCLVGFFLVRRSRSGAPSRNDSSTFTSRSSVFRFRTRRSPIEKRGMASRNAKTFRIHNASDRFSRTIKAKLHRFVTRRKIRRRSIQV